MTEQQETAVEEYHAHQCAWTREGALPPRRHRRLAVFASFDKHYRLSPVALYWLEALTKVTDAVVFVADHAIAVQDEEELRRHVVHYECRRHGEYDFGSYKRGYLFLKESGLLEEADELLFCNDSCYGPMKPLEEILADYASHPGYGVYGLTRNCEMFKYSDHVQSFFLLFPARVFRADYFDGFMCAVQHEEKKSKVVRKYEVGLSVMLRKHGEKIYTFDHMYALYNITMFYWQRFLCKCGMVKRSLLPEWAEVESVAAAVAARRDYPVEYIMADSAKERAMAVILKDLPAGDHDTVRVLDCRGGGVFPAAMDACGKECTLCLVSPYMEADALEGLLQSPAGVCTLYAPSAEGFATALRACLDKMGVGPCRLLLGEGTEVYGTVDALCAELARRENAKTPKRGVSAFTLRRRKFQKWFRVKKMNVVLRLMEKFC